MYRAESTKVIVYIIVVARHYRNREFGSFGSAESADHRTQSQPDKVDYQETHITFRQVGEKRLSVTYRVGQKSDTSRTISKHADVDS